MKQRLYRIACWLITGVGSVFLLGLIANAWVIGSTRQLIYDDLSRIPPHGVALLLGTSPYTHTGRPNLLFTNRIKAASALYQAHVVRQILVSGANPSSAYNEPRKMYQALRRRGVPGGAITLDFAGFRTLDSIIRAHRVFKLQSFVIVSQRYHEYRALFLAHHEGLDAVGYTWPNEDQRQSMRTEGREYLARIKAVLDLYVLYTRPRFLGKPHPIEPGRELPKHYIAELVGVS